MAALTARAAAIPLPGPLAAAFAAEPIRVGPITFREPTIGDYEVLHLIGSPMYDSFNAALSGSESKCTYSFAQIRDVVFLFSSPAAEARRLAATPDQFREAAAQALQDVPLGLLPRLMEAARLNMDRSLATKLGTAPADENFPPPPPGTPATPSAGG